LAQAPALPPSPAANEATYERAKFIEIDGKPYLWRNVLQLRREQLRAFASAQQPPLFELRFDREARAAAHRRRAIPGAVPVRKLKQSGAVRILPSTCTSKKMYKWLYAPG
jgi:hypothetical protein